VPGERHPAGRRDGNRFAGAGRSGTRGRRPGTLAAAAVLALAALASGCGGCREEPPPPAYVQATNEGEAYLENRDSANATAAFQRAVEALPESPAARRNLARAQLLAREHAAALESLTKARELEGDDSAATEYLTGLAHSREGRFAEAIPHLEAAVRLDPGEPPLRFQLANAYQTEGRTEQAIEQLEETVRLDPLHSSAVFKLGSFARQAGDREKAERLQQEFLRLREVLGDASRSAEALETSVYTRAEPAGSAGSPADGDEAAPAVRFALAPEEALPAGEATATAAAVLSVDEAGRPILAVADAAGGLALIAAGEGGGFEWTPLAVALPFAAAELIAGNVYDEVAEGERFDPAVHARNDLLALGPAGEVRLLIAVAEGGFADVTESAGLAGATAAGAAWVDFDHDGDLDLAAAGDAGLALWQNNGDATFTEVGGEVGIGDVAPATGVAAADLDGDVAVDLVVARGDTSGTLVLANRRTGTFARTPEPPGPWPPARRVLIDDFDNDGAPEALLFSGTGATLLHPGGPEAGELDLGFDGASAAAPGALARLDYDNDGWLDLAAAAGGAVRLWRNRGERGFTEVTAAAGLEELRLPDVRALTAADLDADGDTDLVAVTSEGLRLLVNEGGNARRQIKLRLVGTKTNPAGLGTHVEVRAGDALIAREVDRPVVEIGVGDAARLDSVQTLWTNGVVDNQVGVDPGAPGEPVVLTILEKNVATGSCPFLYAWDGDRFEFVTDLLGNSPVGLQIARGAVLPADPDELVVIGGAGALAPRDGYYELEVTSEFREVAYLDHARLVAVDHEPGVEIGVTDRLMPPPFPPSEAWALGRRRPLVSAHGDDGIDRTAPLAERDGRFADCGVPLPPPYRGTTAPLALTFDFGPLDGPRDELGRPVLALTGWLQYGDASTNIALSQNRALTIVPPTLEAETAPGRWQPLDVVVGMPAGKTKTILVDLAGRLPAGARRLRLTTTFEIRWDRAALFDRLPAAALEIRELLPTATDLYDRGFSDLRQRAPLHPTTPAYEEVSAQPPWRTTPAGWATRYGAVDELVAERDGRVVLLNAGDALRLRFDAAAIPPPAPGSERTWLFYSVGWDKDADHNVIAGDTVGPMPDGVDPDPEWQRRWNTRWVPPDKHRPANQADHPR
jgi:tetratricopeptide (TPR) repeat protein